MNRLSWLLYTADACDSLNNWLGVVAFIAGLLTALFSIYAIMEQCKEGAKVAVASLTMALGLMALSIAVPNSNTIYMIAASELAEQVASTEVGVKLTNIIMHKLDALDVSVTTNDTSTTATNSTK